MSVLYANCVDKETFLERFDHRVEIPELGTPFMHGSYDLYMMLFNKDRSNMDDPDQKNVVFGDYIYARSEVALKNKIVRAEGDLRVVDLWVVSNLGNLSSMFVFDTQSMVLSARPSPEFEISINGNKFKAPFRTAFFHRSVAVS